MSKSASIVPVPRCDLSIRPATLADVPFMDALQKLHGRMVGWFPTKQFEGYVKMDAILVAETGGRAVGYCIAKDRYSGRDDVGAIYQLNVAPTAHRKLIGAALVRATFARAAYGCRLFCCWCAQDIDANYFWQSVGFVPIAFRTGSRNKGKNSQPRTHIFWQRRIREGDDGVGATPWWYPHQTRGGAIREDRLVFPIPPGTHWRDAKPVILPRPEVAEPPEATPLALPGGAPIRTRPDAPQQTQAAKMAVVRSGSRHLHGLPAGKAAVLTANGIRYIERGDAPTTPPVPESEAIKEKPKRAPKPRSMHDKQQIAFVRELRDRYLEKIEQEPWLLADAGTYDVSRSLAGPACEVAQARLVAPRLKALPPMQAA